NRRIAAAPLETRPKLKNSYGVQRTLTCLLVGRKIYTRHSKNFGERIDSDGKLRTRHMVYTKQVKLITKPSFYKVLKRANSCSHLYEERDPDISSALLKLQKLARG
ncbi:hypothetical protein, partial [Acinetobacter ursingii]|uniref:hypothetical protein n=1 Tax=Acinetobacter ursingii TaxID=108980 RepID=UPI0021CDC71B